MSRHRQAEPRREPPQPDQDDAGSHSRERATSPPSARPRGHELSAQVTHCVGQVDVLALGIEHRRREPAQVLAELGDGIAHRAHVLASGLVPTLELVEARIEVGESPEHPALERAEFAQHALLRGHGRRWREAPAGHTGGAGLPVPHDSPPGSAEST